MPALVGPPDPGCEGDRGARFPRRDDAALRGFRTQPGAGGPDRLMALARAVIEELRRVVGRGAVIDSANDLRIFERDGSIEGAVPDAVVLASTTEQVAGVIKAAAKHNIPVVLRGAGTGLSGGAVTIRGGIALQVTRMRRILNIDPVAQTAIVEPGVVNQELSRVPP